MASFRLWIWVLSWLPSLVVTEHEITCMDQCTQASEHRNAWRSLDMMYGVCVPPCTTSLLPGETLRRHAPGPPWRGQRRREHSAWGGGIDAFSRVHPRGGGPTASGNYSLCTLSSASRGRCSRISNGSVSAAMTTNSEMPRFRVLVAAMTCGKVQNAVRQRAVTTMLAKKTRAPSLAPFFSCL